MPMLKHDWPRGSGRTKFHTVYTIKKVTGVVFGFCCCNYRERRKIKDIEKRKGLPRILINHSLCRHAKLLCKSCVMTKNGCKETGPSCEEDITSKIFLNPKLRKGGGGGRRRRNT